MESTTTLPKQQVVEVLREARTTEHDAQVRQLQLALQWALLHPCLEGEHPASWGEVGLYDDTTRPLAGPGAPLIAGTAPLELAAALDRPTGHAEELLADALELAFRLPRLWDLLLTGQVRVWTARLISRETHDLTLDSALHADRLICAVPARIAQVDARRLIDQARLYADPDRAHADEEAALARRGVWLRQGRAPATTEISMTLDPADAHLFNASVTRVAADLKGLGDTDDLDLRRAKAVGVLADPQHALDLMSGRPDAQPTRGGTGSLDLFVHLTAQDLSPEGDGTGVAVAEKLGALTLELLREWMATHLDAGGRITLRPVIDLTDTTDAQDAHDPSARLHEHVVLRDAHCVFPGCRRDSRGCDLDHIAPYVPPDQGGPPGQTRAVNLAPLCRRHHNAKTHHAWSYHRHSDGTYAWTSPTGHRYDVLPVTRAPLRDFWDTREP